MTPSLDVGKFDLVMDDLHITGNPDTKQVLITFDARGIGKVGILLEGAEMQVIQDEGIIEFWKTEIYKERTNDRPSED